jgi:anti-sigma-K factor RskA
MTCEEFSEMAPAYVLAILDEVEWIACTRHLAQDGPHRRCPEAVDKARRITAHLCAALPARTPPPHLWRAIEARIADVRVAKVGSKAGSKVGSQTGSKIGGFRVVAARSPAREAAHLMRAAPAPK